MRQVNKVESWVVYETPARQRMAAMRVVCEQGEWPGLKTANPEYRLVLTGVTNEGEAERSARAGTVGLKNAPKKYR